MKHSKFVGRFDLDVTLNDEAVEPRNSPTRRMLANAAIGMEPDDAYYATCELREAVEWVHEGMRGGKRKLTMILGNSCDDYQRCLFYIVAGRGVIRMMDNLLWLQKLLEARGRVAGVVHARKMPRVPLYSPYVAAEPDGPVGKFSDTFEPGPSWWTDPDVDAETGLRPLD